MERYGSLIDNPQGFIDSVLSPLPVSVWVNTLKSTAPALTAYLAELGVDLAPIDWMPGAFRASSWPSPGQTLAFTAGWYYVQEEIAQVAVQALGPQPGERILDLCAAPGGKTAQIALRLQNTGLVVANELHTGRFPSLSATIARLGLTNVITTQGDGRAPLFPTHAFDRVLVDAPCSGEGTLRRRRAPRPWQERHSSRIATAQKKLLSQALDAVKPGGVVVYSTCTFAPEENEAVLDAVMGDRAHLEAFNIPGLQGQPGLNHWQGTSFRSDLSLAQRYFPHFNNTGGFFVARLRRSDISQQASAHTPRTVPEMPPVPWPRESPLATFGQRFAIAAPLLKDYSCWATGKNRLWLTRCRDLPVAFPPQTLGIPLASQTNLGLKPSTAFLQCFGPLIQQHAVDLPHAEAAVQFVRGQSQPLPAMADQGYVHVRFGIFQLGCGHASHGLLHSQLPKMLRWASPSPPHTPAP